MAVSITQSHSTYRYSAAPLPTFTGTGAAGTITWSSPDGGTFSPATTTNGQPTTYTPLNRTQQATIQAHDSTGDVTTTLGVQATFPDRGNYHGVSRKLKDRVNKSVAEDEGESDVIKGKLQQTFTYNFPANAVRDIDHWLMVQSFWLWHRKGPTSFFIEDPQQDEVFYWVQFDSELQRDDSDNNLIGFSAAFREV